MHTPQKWVKRPPRPWRSRAGVAKYPGSSGYPLDPGVGHANTTIGMQSLSMLRAYRVHRVTLVYGPRQAIHLLRYLSLEPTAGSLGLSGIQGRLSSMVSLPHALDILHLTLSLPQYCRPDTPSA